MKGTTWEFVGGPQCGITVTIPDWCDAADHFVVLVLSANGGGPVEGVYRPESPDDKDQHIARWQGCL